MNRLTTKKRKVDHVFSLDVIYEISQFIYEIEDYLHLTQTNKYFYEYLLKKEPNEMLSNVTYRFDLPLSIKLLPMATAFTKLALGIEDNVNLFYLLNNFTNLKVIKTSYDLFTPRSHYNLQIDKLNQLEELYLNNDQLQIHNFLNLNNLQILHADIDNDYCIKNLFNLTELKIETKWKDNFTGKYLPKLQNLKFYMLVTQM